MSEYFYTSKNVDIDIDITMSDVEGFIDEMNVKQRTSIINYCLRLKTSKNSTIEDEQKAELLQLASGKFTLIELEKKLGNKFDLM